MQSDLIELRGFCLDDVADVFEYASREGVGEGAGWKAHSSVEDSRKLVNSWLNDEDVNAIVYKPANKVIGHICIDEDSEEGRDDTRELGFVVNRDFWGNGVATQAVKLVLDKLKARGIKYVWACCFKENLASKRVIEKCGFEFMQEGRFYSESLDKEFDSLEYRLTL